MNKAQLIEAVADKLGASKKEAGDAVDAVLDSIISEVAGGTKVSITGFGSFEKVKRPARTARNPRTGESVKVKASSAPKFKAGQGFKDIVNGEKKAPAATAAKAAAKKAAPTKKAAPAKKTATAAAGRATAAKTTAKKASPAKK